MDNKFSTIKERVSQIAKYYNISYDKFFTDIGMTYGSFKGKAKQTPLNSDAIENILTSFPEVDADWLITGKGEMIKGTQIVPKETIAQRYQLCTDKIIDQQNVPLYELEATASLVSLFLDNTANVVLGYISIPDMPQCDGAVYVRGDSMYPLLKSGDIVLYKQVKDFQHGVLWGEMYLVAFELDGEEYVTIKYVQKSENSTHVRLVSQNQHHASQEIRINMIRALALVKGSIRYNTMR